MPCARSSTTLGRATCASSPTPSSALWCSRADGPSPEPICRWPCSAPTPRAAPRSLGADLTLRKHGGALEEEIIREALQRSGGKRREAADLLGISVRALFYKLKNLGIADM